MYPQIGKELKTSPLPYLVWVFRSWDPILITVNGIFLSDVRNDSIIRFLISPYIHN